MKITICTHGDDVDVLVETEDEIKQVEPKVEIRKKPMITPDEPEEIEPEKQKEEPKTEINKKLAENILKERVKNKWTQSALGQLTGTTQAAVSSWERGIREPEEETMKRLAHVFKCDAEFLKGEQEERQK